MSSLLLSLFVLCLRYEPSPIVTIFSVSELSPIVTMFSVSEI